jgi:hypothetical protein
VERDSFTDNRLTGEKGVDGRDDLILRGRLLWDVSESFSAKLTAYYAEIHAAMTPAKDGVCQR